MFNYLKFIDINVYLDFWKLSDDIGYFIHRLFSWIFKFILKIKKIYKIKKNLFINLYIFKLWLLEP